LVSDILAGDGKIKNIFLQCILWQVYIMAAGWSSEPFSPRRVPRSLLLKMVRLRLRNEGIHLTDINPNRDVSAKISR
jgi:hypothetical protein